MRTASRVGSRANDLRLRGNAVIDFYIEVDGIKIDECQCALPITVKQGRGGTDAQPDAPECEFFWIGPDFVGYLGASINIVARVENLSATGWEDTSAGWVDPQVSWFESYTLSRRFTGQITGMRARREKNAIVGYDVTAVGNMPKLNKIKVEKLWPEETDFNRIQRLGIQGGITINIAGSQTMQMRAIAPEAGQTSEKVPILDAIHEVCRDTGGLFWEDRDGEYWYGSINHRATDPTQILPCVLIEDGVTWDIDLDSLINQITVEFGPDTDRRERFDENAASVAKHGKYPFGYETNLLTETDAVLLTTIIMRRRSEEYWRNSDVMLLIGQAPVTGYQNIQNVNIGSGVLTELDSSPAVTTGYKPWSVEGWIETIDAEHVIQYSLSDRNKYGDIGINNWDDMRQETWNYWTAYHWINVIIRSD